MSSRARVAFTCAAVVVNLRPLCAGPVCVAVRVETGHGVYKGHEVVPCDASMHVLQKAEGLLWPEKARFHKVGSISAHFVIHLLAAFFSKCYVIVLPGVA